MPKIYAIQKRLREQNSVLEKDCGIRKDGLVEGLSPKNDCCGPQFDIPDEAADNAISKTDGDSQMDEISSKTKNMTVEIKSENADDEKKETKIELLSEADFGPDPKANLDIALEIIKARFGSAQNLPKLRAKQEKLCDTTPRPLNLTLEKPPRSPSPLDLVIKGQKPLPLPPTPPSSETNSPPTADSPVARTAKLLQEKLTYKTSPLSPGFQVRIGFPYHYNNIRPQSRHEIEGPQDLRLPQSRQVSVIQRNPAQEAISKKRSIMCRVENIEKPVESPIQTSPIDYHIPKREPATVRMTSAATLQRLIQAEFMIRRAKRMAWMNAKTRNHGTSSHQSSQPSYAGGSNPRDNGGCGGYNNGNNGTNGGNMNGGNSGTGDGDGGSLPPFYQGLKLEPMDCNLDMKDDQSDLGLLKAKDYQILHNATYTGDANGNSSCSLDGFSLFGNGKGPPHDSVLQTSNRHPTALDPLPSMNTFTGGGGSFHQRYSSLTSSASSSSTSSPPSESKYLLPTSNGAAATVGIHYESLFDNVDALPFPILDGSPPETASLFDFMDGAGVVPDFYRDNELDSLTPSPPEGTAMNTPLDASIDPLPEHSNSNGGGKMNGFYSHYAKATPPYPEIGSRLNLDIFSPTPISQLPPNNSPSPQDIFSPELPSPAQLSLPSPGPVSSPDDSIGTPSKSSSNGGSNRRGSTNGNSGSTPADISKIPSLQVRISILQQRGVLKPESFPSTASNYQLGLPSDVPIEFVNGGHGIKNPLAANCDRLPGEPAPVEQKPRTPIVCDTDPSKFACHLCNKAFTLQRLLNRHMKCHSDVKRYLCTFCGKGFNDTFDLKRHTRTHTGVRPYRCNLCEKSFTQRCSLESHCLKVHGVQHQFAYKERRNKVYVCEECGHTTAEPEMHYVHLKDNHPYSPALLKFYDKRHFKFNNNNFANILLQVRS